MTYRISDIPTHNSTPSGANKIEMENPTGPNSEWATLDEVLANLAASKVLDVGFSADQTGNASGLWDKANLNSVVTDTLTAWDNTNHKYVPPAGLYLFTWTCGFDMVTGAGVGVSIYKNGVADQRNLIYSGTTNVTVMQVSALIDMNGTTDFVEPYVLPKVTTGSATFYKQTATIVTKFVAARLRGAAGKGPLTFFGDWNSTAQAAFTLTGGVWAGQQHVLPVGFVVTHVCFISNSTDALAHMTPAIYSVNVPGGTLNTKVADGATVVGTVAGLMELPLSTPYTVPASGAFAIGANMRVVNFAIGAKAATLAQSFAVSSDTPLTTPGTVTSTSQTWAGFFVKGYFPA